MKQNIENERIGFCCWYTYTLSQVEHAFKIIVGIIINIIEALMTITVYVVFTTRLALCQVLYMHYLIYFFILDFIFYYFYDKYCTNYQFVASQFQICASLSALR